MSVRMILRCAWGLVCWACSLFLFAIGFLLGLGAAVALFKASVRARKYAPLF